MAELSLVVEGPKICVLPVFFKSKGEMGEGQVIDKWKTTSWTKVFSIRPYTRDSNSYF